MKRLALLLIFVIVTSAPAASQAPDLQIIFLPAPALKGPLSLEETLAARRSVRRFADKPLELPQLSQLAWAAQGITDKQTGFRTAPSAGAVFPISLYLATKDGLFLYNPQQHNLQWLITADLRPQLANAAFSQQSVAQAPAVFIIAGSVQKLAAKYAAKARQYLLLEAGHIAQNIHLQAVALGLGSVPIGAFEPEQVAKLCKLSTTIEPLYIIPVGCQAAAPSAKTRTDPNQTKEPIMTQAKTKKAVLIIARENFRDEELFETRKQLENASIQTTIACSKIGTIKGMLGRTAQASVLFNDIAVDDYDAVVFIGGSGAKEYFDDPAAHTIARQAVEKGKLLAAICIAPSILANAGLLKNVKAACYPSEQANLKKSGAIVTSASVEKDGLIITATGPQAATLFGQTIAQSLTNR